MENHDLLLPVSGAHLQLLDIMLLLSMLMFVTYTGILFGSSLLSVHYKRKAKKTGNSHYSTLSFDIINTITSTPVIWFGLGIAPLIGTTFLYVQLLKGIETDVLAYLIGSFVFLIATLGAVYTYRNALVSTNVLSKSHSEDNEVHETLDFQSRVASISGFWIIVANLLSIWLFLAANVQATNSLLWDSKVLGILFDASTLWQLAHIYTGAIAIAAASFIYFNYVWTGGREFANEEYKDFAKKTTTKIALWYSAVQPFFFAMNIYNTPQNGISYNIYIYAAIAMICLIFATQFFYAMLKENKVDYMKYAFWLVLASFFSMVAKEHGQFSTSNHENILIVAADYDRMEAERIAAEGGGEAVVIDAEEIYKTRCAACHKFDVSQPTAPAYNNVVPKYFEKQDEMVKFILNPYPINKAEYPAGMANQGLKPAEAKAMAEWIIGQVKKNTGEAK